MVYVLGVTGGIACGKTAATDHFATHGIEVIDADLVARDLVTKHSPALQEIVKHFGSSMLQSDGNLNRAALRQRIFNHEDDKQWLENLLHPLIRQTIEQQLNKAKTSKQPYIILSAPLMLETDLHTLADRVLVIDCDEKIQLERACQRDNSDTNTIKNIIQQQLNRQDRLAKADDAINNNESLEQLQQAVDNYHQQLMIRLYDANN